MVRQALLLATLVVVETNMAAEPAKSVDVRLHQLQVIGTHNSYHIAPSKPVMAAIAAMDDGLAKSLDYTHRPLSEQFSRLGIRQIELDVFADPQGGLYAEPAARRMTKQTNDAWDPNGVMKQPGMKVLHVQDIDFRSTVPTLVDALQEIRAWSTAHPQSCPIMVMIELKQSSIGPEFTQPLPFDREQLDALDEEIQSVFAGEEIILPDDVRGRRETLREAVLNDGWPKLDDVRGKVMFAMDNGGDLAAAYLADHPSLRGRVLFVSVPESEPAAAFMKRNNPVADFEAIQRLVKQGFLVRTRADAGTRQSRQNDGSQRDRAFASGAHFISTDYPEPDQRFSDYRVRFPHGVVARKNPVSGLSPDDREFDLADDGRIQLIAHRGGVVDQDRIENNLPAIEEAILRGYAMLEVDIRESKDGRLVVHHDASFDRYYGDSRKVADLTWVQIKQLRSTPGDLRPLDLEEFAAACHGKIALMLDTKGPDHEVAFFQEMERILKRHELLATALVIGTEQSKQYFHGKAKTSVNRRELEKAIRSAEEASRLYFLFEHGDMTDETIALAQRHGVQIVPSINIFHYPQEQHLQRAETDIRRLRRLGVRCFQIDSAYEASCRP